MRFWLGVLVAVGIVLAVGATLLGTGAVRLGGGSSAGVEVRVQPVERGELVEVVSAPGQVEPRTRVQISARISARIAELPYAEGARVHGPRAEELGGGEEGGSVLVRLDATDLAASLRAAEARYAAQQASLDVASVRLSARRADLEATRVLLADAERELNRQRKLLATSDVSQAAVDAAETRYDQLLKQAMSLQRSLEADEANLRVLRHELEAAAAQIEQARENLSYAVIRSPIDGTVTRVNARVGELVVTGTMNNPGTVILEVADLSRMLVVARVDESAIANVAVGQRATARSTAYPGRAFTGVVQSVALAKTTPAQAAQRGEPSDGVAYYRTEILLDEGQEVLSGVSADVEISVRRHENVLRVPSQAVLGRKVDELPEAALASATVDRTRTIATVVFLMKDGKAEVRPVKVGPSDLTHTRIDAGLEEGELVIVGPYKALEGLKHGDAVRLAETASGTGEAGTPSAGP
ncbi:MAG: efflux RND transporter periplasmic adaptor subunit [Tepidisphaerales bacterium]